MIENLDEFSLECQKKIKNLILNANDPIYRIVYDIDKLVNEIIEFEEIKKIGVQLINTELGKFLSSIKMEKMYTVNEFIQISKYFRIKPYSVQHVHKFLKKETTSIFYNNFIEMDYGIVIPEELVKKYYIINYIDSKLVGLYTYKDILDFVYKQTGQNKSKSYVSRHFDPSINGYVKLGLGEKISNVTYITKEEVNKFLNHKNLKTI